MVAYRFFDLKTAVILNANGSARLVLDHTDVLVAVKARTTHQNKLTTTYAHTHAAHTKHTLSTHTLSTHTHTHTHTNEVVLSFGFGCLG